MIWVTRKQKIQRDRNAGLVFHWRGGYAGNRGGFTLALILSACIYIMMFLSLNVYVNSTAAPSKYQASIIHVSEVSDGMRWWLERKLPSLPSWYLDQDALGVASVRNKMYDVMDKSEDRSITWRELPAVDESLKSSSLLELGTFQLTHLERGRKRLAENEESLEVAGPKAWELVIDCSSKESAKRLPDQRRYAIDASQFANFYGETVKFVVHLSNSGEVISCVPLKWNVEVEVKLLEQWVNTLQFKETLISEESPPFDQLVLSVKMSEKKIGK